MCKKERENDSGLSERRGFRNRYDSRIFVEPFDFFHVFSGLDFPDYLSTNLLINLKRARARIKIS